LGSLVADEGPSSHMTQVDEAWNMANQLWKRRMLVGKLDYAGLRMEDNT
jgi:hypothetical protein